MSKNLAIIDSDSICYLGSKEDSLQQVLDKVNNKINEILVETKADYYVLLLSKGKYFRHELAKAKSEDKSLYKANRTYGGQIWVNTIKEYLIAKYNAVWYSKLEADDICAWLVNKKLGYAKEESKFRIEPWNILESAKNYLENEAELPQEYTLCEINKILVAKDKDLLYSIPGKHLNFSKKFSDGTYGMEWVETSTEKAFNFKIYQLLCGDTGDNIMGCGQRTEKIYGPKAAKAGQAYLSRVGITPKQSEAFIETWKGINVMDHVLHTYIDFFKDESVGIFEFQKNYRLLHMLTTDKDMLREVGYIPELPEFQQVNKLEEDRPIIIDF